MSRVEEHTIEYLMHINQLRNSELDVKRVPLVAESELMRQVREGRYKDIAVSPFSKLSPSLGKMAKDDMTQYTYLVVAAVTLFSRIALEQDVPPDMSFDLSDALLYYLSHCQTIEEIHGLYETAAIMFAKLIDRQKSDQGSYQIGRIQNYISANIYKKITVAQIAEHVGLTPNYLCGMFGSQMGISLHNYIQKEKISVACNLLKHTDGTISYVSSYMGFQSQSNFSLVFRKWMGMTPTEYRDINYREVF